MNRRYDEIGDKFNKNEYFSKSSDKKGFDLIINNSNYLISCYFNLLK
jgi:hypothetical protein